MSLRDYDGWRRYAKWKRENYEAWERSVKKQNQMSDGKTEALKGTYFKNKSKMPINFDPKQPKKQSIEQTLGLMPDQKWHRIVSFVKSGIRIAGYCFIPFNLLMATFFLLVSEVVGIIEELV
jgi:hypothetical protein